MKFTKRERYLLTKLAEEAAEVAQSALKHMLKGTVKSERRLASECGDFRALLRACVEAGLVDSGTVLDSMQSRGHREDSKVRK